MNRTFALACSPLRVITVAALLLVNPAHADDAAELQSLLAGGKYTEALKKADQLLAAKPNDARLLMQRGVALSSLNRNADAMAVFQKLTEIHPELPGPYNNLAVLHAAAGDYEKARATLELAIRTNPSYATAFQNLGDVYARLASQAYKKALTLDKADTSLPLKLSVIQNVFEPPTDPRTGKALAGAKPAATTVAAAPVAQAVTPPAKTTAAPPPAPTPVVVAAAKPSAPPAVAPAKPAPSAVVASTKPVPVAAPAAPAVSDNDAVAKAVQAWAQAWSQRDMNAYFAAYDASFKGKSASRKAWEEDRRSRIVSKKHIRVALDKLKVDVKGNTAHVRFKQSYTSDALEVQSRKTLELVRNSAGQWVIANESTG